VLVGYASMIRVLAEEQLAGRLQIAPRAVNSASEVLSGAGRGLATRAGGVPPFDVYAATETGGIAAECAHHTGMHLFEDLVIAEVVDDDYAPVPAGTTGARLLVTVLSSRTLPLIRFELTDRVRLSTGTCPCGRPFRLVAGIEGRTDDVLTLPAAAGGTVAVHPVVFHQALDLFEAAGWQVHQDDDGLTLLVASPGPTVDPAPLWRRRSTSPLCTQVRGAFGGRARQCARLREVSGTPGPRSAAACSMRRRRSAPKRVAGAPSTTSSRVPLGGRPRRPGTATAVSRRAGRVVAPLWITLAYPSSKPCRCSAAGVTSSTARPGTSRGGGPTGESSMSSARVFLPPTS